ncbi:peroxisomal biogenesis factor 3 [Anopheles bellator]|uniref:peroxisomal biogenesis factor 3 n=1 Tax=Anopheles bellator TaxID=139047 RepID=UPI002647B5FA|nr:peroxisomal biogenesis factor 3 [Anopheles bellator]XP_058058861.1 peroxisomal biogenesis factor 3 [Anopheles bellator]XP_058058862.1 peroxisomal biogenesis factor 3 [Anopheles bellator]
MLERLKDFLYRHRKKFITTGIVLGGSVFLLKWIQYKLRELQERQAKEIGEKLRRMQHFECTDRTCNQTIAGLAPALSDKLFERLNTDDILVKLRSNPENKLELWEQLKIVAFTRIVALVYAASMLSVTLKVQINILGGYLYRDTVAEEDASRGRMASEQQISPNIQTAYLSMIQHFMSDGVYELIEIVRQNVGTVMQRYNLKQPLTLADTETLLWSIQMALNNEEASPARCIARYTLNPSLCSKMARPGTVLGKMFDETLDVLESVESRDVSLANVSNGFSLVVDTLADYYMEGDAAIKPAPENGKSNLNVECLANINNISISLAKLIPIVNGMAGKRVSVNGATTLVSGTTGLPMMAELSGNMMASMIGRFLQSEKLRTLGANVYETFCQ